MAPVDEELASAIAKASGFSYVPEAHAKEHSVEVQVPFIQRALPGAKIVPIILGYPTRRNVYSLAEGMAEACSGKNVLIVASTDLSHYLSKADANSVDSKTISLLKNISAITLGQPAAEFSLSAEEKKELLRLARQAVQQFVVEKKVIAYETTDPNLLAERGAFVTLKKRGDLRGCIGFIEPVPSLSRTAS